MLEKELWAIHNRVKTVILEPRGAAKTTWGNTSFLSWLISEYPDIRVGLISNTATQSFAFSRAIRWTLEANPRHQEIYGNCVSPSKWTDQEWLHKESRWHGSKDVTVFATGTGGPIISKRFDLILCDDILDEENTITPEQREKVETWFTKTLLPCLAPDGVVVMLGTRWAEDDLYQKLTDPVDEGGKGWELLRRQAVEVDDKGKQRSYWPEYWPMEKLEETRIELGTPVFMCAYQNDIRGLMQGNIFRSADWKWEGFYFSELPEGHRYVTKMGIDLASSEKQRADWTARGVVARCSCHGDYWVLHVYRDKRETGHAGFISDGYTAYPQIQLVRCENNQFQSTLIQEVMRDYPHIPIEGFKVDVDKVTRARAVAAKYEAKKVHHHISLKGGPYELELLGFPKGHDDMIDAVGHAMDLGGGGLSFGAVKR